MPSMVQKQLGPSGILAYAVCGILCLLIGLCFCEMSGTYEGTGGAGLYARKSFGSFAGYLVGWQIWLSSIIGWASVAKGFFIYWKGFIVSWKGSYPSTWILSETVILFLLIMVLSILNYRGVKQGSGASNFFALTKLLPLLAFIALGLFSVKAQNFCPFFTGTAASIGPAIIIVLYVYTGFEDISLPAGEGVDSRRDLPRALLYVLGGSTVIYILVQIVAVGVYPGLASSERPLIDAASAFMGTGGALFIALGGLLSMGGINSSIALTGPRALYALAEGRYLPRWLSSIHSRYCTPHNAIMLNSLLVLLLALTGTFKLLLDLSVLAALWQYIPTCLAVIKARVTGQRASSFIVPGGYVIPLLALALAVVLVVQMGWANLGWSLAGTAIGLPFYFFRRRRASEEEKRPPGPA